MWTRAMNKKSLAMIAAMPGSAACSAAEQASSLQVGQFSST